MTARSRVAPRRGPPALGHAEFAPRVLAWFIDLAAISILHGIVSQEIVGPGFYFLLNGLASQTDSPLVLIWQIIVVGAIEVAAIVLLLVGFLRTLRATPGQRLVGLLTVTSGAGQRLPWLQAVGRCLMLYGPWVAILALPPFFASGLASEYDWVITMPWAIRVAALLWYVALAVTSRAPGGRGFHDLASRSVVVRRAA